MRHYLIERTPQGVTAEVLDSDHPPGGYALDPRHDLRNHSPDGFEFGYSGSGPSQLALALLADALGDDALAAEHYHAFKSRVIAPIEGDRFEISQEEIRQVVHRIAQQQRGGLNL
jgi:hypothetical protein